MTGYNWSHPDFVRLAADVTGDGRADVVAFGPDGIWVALNRGDGTFNPPRRVSTEMGLSRGWTTSKHLRLTADLTGDGKADVIGFGDAGVWTAISKGDGSFAGPNYVLAAYGVQQQWTSDKFVRLLADVTGDGRADIVGFGQEGVFTSTNLGNGTFTGPVLKIADFGYNTGWRVDQHPRFAVDITGDRKADIVAFGLAGVWTALADGAGGFQPQRMVLAEFGLQQAWGAENPRMMGDITGDGRADIVGFANAGVWTALSNGDGAFAAPRLVIPDLGYDSGWRVANHIRTLADVTGDGKLDIVAFGDGGVWVALSNGDGTFAAPKLVLADMGYKQGWRRDLHPRFVTDMTGDRKADLFGFAAAGLNVSQSLGGGSFSAIRGALNDFGVKSSPIKHVFMLMMENRSFDHLFGFSGITGIDAETGQPTKVDGLTGAETNFIKGAVTEKYTVERGAKYRMPTDPNHEFADVLRQLCGVDADLGDRKYPPGGPYPPIDNSGFAISYRRSGGADPTEVMRCFTPDQIPELMELATKYAICDRWFSSMAGPTWPNRMFAHAASSGYLDDSPENNEIAWWEVFPGAGFPFGNGTLYRNIDNHGGNWRIYSDDKFPMTSALDGISIRQIRDVNDLGKDIAKADFDTVQYVHIEPNYDTFGEGPSANANSHHPVSDIRKGNAFIRRVYDTIRNSRVWNECMLIITWDEHGGFYDHVIPPKAPRPNDRKTGESSESNINHHNFAFDQYGPRVPAIIISPWIPAGTIDHRLYDHASIPASVERLFNFPHLTDRDAQANSPLALCTLSAPRKEPIERPQPPIAGDGGIHQGRPVLHQRSAKPPTIGLAMAGYIRSALVLDIQIQGEAAAKARAAQVKNNDDARLYLWEVEQRVMDFRAGKFVPPTPPVAHGPPPPPLPPTSKPINQGRPPILPK